VRWSQYGLMLLTAGFLACGSWRGAVDEPSFASLRSTPARIADDSALDFACVAVVDTERWRSVHTSQRADGDSTVHTFVGADARVVRVRCRDGIVMAYAVEHFFGGAAETGRYCDGLYRELSGALAPPLVDRSDFGARMLSHGPTVSANSLWRLPDSEIALSCTEEASGDVSWRAWISRDRRLATARWVW